MSQDENDTAGALDWDALLARFLALPVQTALPRADVIKLRFLLECGPHFTPRARRMWTRGNNLIKELHHLEKLLAYNELLQELQDQAASQASDSGDADALAFREELDRLRAQYEPIRLSDGDIADLERTVKAAREAGTEPSNVEYLKTARAARAKLEDADDKHCSRAIALLVELTQNNRQTSHNEIADRLGIDPSTLRKSGKFAAYRKVYHTYKPKRTVNQRRVKQRRAGDPGTTV